MGTKALRALVFGVAVILAGCSGSASSSTTGPSGGGAGNSGGGGGGASPNAGTGGWNVTADVSAFTSATVYDAATNGNGFVAVGSVSQSGHTNGAVWTSADGAAWTSVSMSAPDLTFLRVIRGGPGLVALAVVCRSGGECGAPSSIWTSPDGRSWSQQELYQDGRLAALAAGPFGAVAVGTDTETGSSEQRVDGAAFWSPDGVTWSRASSDASFKGATLGAVAAGGPGVVALGNGSTSLLCWTSTDGRSWSIGPASPALASGEVRDLTTLGSRLVAVGRDGSNAAAWTSSDGRTWTRTGSDPTLQGGVMARVAAVGKMVIAVGKNTDGGALWQSADGSNWMSVKVPGPARQLSAIAANGSRAVVFGTTADGKVVILTGASGS
jgi:hypothetical protein